MTPPARSGLTEADKDALIVEMHAMIERMGARIAELESLVGKPRKTSKNSSVPPSHDRFGRPKTPKRPAKERPPRELR